MARERNTSDTPVVDDGDGRLAQEMSRRGWVKIGGGSGEILKWETGATVEGRFAGIRKGQMGSLIDMEVTAGKTVTYGCPAILKSRVEAVPIGTGLHIRCVGKVPSKRGQDAWNFDVFSKDQLELPLS